MDAHTKGLVLGFGLVMFSVIAAVVVNQIHAGGVGFSHMAKTVEFPFDKLNFDFHRQFFLKRLSVLGFKPAGEGDDFIQGGADLTDLGAASHARTRKMLSLRFQDSAPDKSVALLTLRYLDIVAVDTGESGYRDAVLDFVTGKTDEMQAVSTESLLALNSLVGGILACTLAVLLVISDQLSLWVAIPTIAITEMGAGLYAVYSIGQKPAEIKGRWKAVAGVVLSVAAICLGLFFIISKHSGPPL